MAAPGESIRAITMYTEDFKYSASLESFNRLISFNVFEIKAKTAPVVKFMFTPTTLFRLKAVLHKVVNDQEIKAPIELGCEAFNPDLKIREFKASIAIGRDNDKCIFIDFTGDKHKEPIRFYAITDNRFTINGMELPKLSLTEAGIQTLISVIEPLYTASLNQERPMPKTGGYDNSGPNPSTPPVGDDVLF